MTESTGPTNPTSANPTVWLHFVLSCAVPVHGGICGEAIESESCPAHGTEVPTDV